MVLTALKLFLLVALVVAGIIQAFQRKYTTGIIAIIYAGLLFLPGVLIEFGHRIRDIDFAMTRDDTVIEVRNRGPIALSHRSMKNPYGDRSHHFRTEVETAAGTQDFSFGIDGISRYGYRRPANCLEKPGPDGLVEVFTGPKPEDNRSFRCRIISSERQWLSPEGEGPTSRIRCAINADAALRHCRMRIYYDPFLGSGSA